MKKFIAIFIAIAAMISCFTVTASAASGDFTLELVVKDKYVHGQTETLTAEVRAVNNTEGFTGLNFYIDMPAALSVKDVSTDVVAGPLTSTSGSFLTPLPSTDAHGYDTGVTISYLNYLDNLSIGDGVICTITFTVNTEYLEATDDFSPVLGIYETMDNDGAYSYGEEGCAKLPEVDGQESGAAKVTVDVEECKHPQTEKTDAKPATCTEPGTDGDEICYFCKKVVNPGKQTPSLGHEADPDDEWYADKTTGQHYQECKRCQAHINLEDHKAATGAEWETEDPNEHYHLCEKCGAKIDAEEHVDEDSDGTCDICEGQLHQHVIDEAKGLQCDDEFHYYACAVPGCTAKLQKAAHTFKTETTKEATCTEKGTKTITCTVEGCPYTKTEDIDMVPHTYNTEPDEVKEATCEKDGLKTWTCTVCKKQTKTEVISATGHKNDGTWKSDGTNHWHVCLNENCDYEDKIYDKAAHTPKADLEHDEDAHWTVCSVCGKEGEHEEHTEGEAYVDENGHGHLCADCPEKFDYEAHTLTKVEAVEATPGQNGNIAYWTCEGDLCSDYYFIDGDGDGEPDSMIYGDEAFEKTIVTKYAVGCETLGHQFLCVPATDEYHLLICARQCGVAIPMPHNFTINGRCRDCGYVRPALTTGVVVTPVTSGDIYNEVLPYGVIGVYDVSATGLTGRVAVRVFAPNATVNSIVLVRSGWDVLTSANLTVDGSGYATFMVDAAVINQYRYFAIVSNFTADDEVEVHTPIEPGDQDSQEEVEEPGDDITVDDTDDVKEDENPKTGVALAVIPMIVAAACTVVSKKH